TGYSVSTVSIAINKKPFRLPEQTRNDILTAAREMGYISNQTAINLRTKHTRTIGLIIPDIRNDFYASFAKGAENFCSEKGWSLIISNTNNSQSKELKYINLLYQQNVAGIIMARSLKYNQSPLDNFKRLADLSIPHVLLDFSGSPSSNVVTDDQEKGGYLVGKYLLRLGHKRVACITGDLGLEGAQSRLAGFRHAFKESGLSLPSSLIYESDYTFDTTLKTVQKMEMERFTAVFAFNDLMALAFINHAKRLGYNIPKDYSVVGYDNTNISRIMYPTLTTVDQSVMEMGQTAANILITHNRNSKRIIKKYIPHLIVRDSTLPNKSRNQ
ncbi:LacI family DNA-binding transcriptional regulator, partial [Clostridium faecium]